MKSLKNLIIHNLKNDIINDFNSTHPELNLFIHDILNNYSINDISFDNDIDYLYPSIHLLIYLLNNYNIYHKSKSKSNKKCNLNSFIKDKKLLKYFNL